MSSETFSQQTAAPVESPSWGPVYAMALCVAALITTEMLPISLLTPIAADLGIAEGMAGQAVTASALVALVTSLLVAVVTRGLDQRVLLLGLTALMTLSSLIVALAPTFTMLMIGRALLGITIGGFWSMSSATAMRLVPERFVPQALGIIMGGSAVASVVAAPLGSYLGEIVGWRGVFLATVPLGLIALAWQFATLPSMPSRRQVRLATLFHLFKRPQVAVGIVDVTLTFTGVFAFFTYMRPFLETVTGVGVSQLSTILLLNGIAGFVGTSFLAPVLTRRLHLALPALPAFMAVLALSLVFVGQSVWAAAALVALLGLITGTIPLVWSTWVTRVTPNEAESGGGLLIASMQLAITLGAFVGGLVLNTHGATGAFSVSAGVLLAAMLVLLVGRRP